MGRNGRTCWVVALVLCAALLLPGVVQAQATPVPQGTQGAVGVYPVQVGISDALRGGEYLRTINLVNQHDRPVVFNLTPEGEVGGWLTLHESMDPKDPPIATIKAQPHAVTPVIARIKVPQDAPNGTHTGTAFFRVEVPAVTGTESAVSVSLGIISEMAIVVSGTQKLSGVVRDIGTENVELDHPLRVKTMFENTGNVKATPSIGLVVTDASGAKVVEKTFADVAVEPGSSDLIRSEWDTTGKPRGKYNVAVTVSLANEQIGEKKLDFEIMPRGTFTSNGQLESLKLESEPKLGTIGKLIAQFRNTGQLDTKAVFVGELLRDGSRVKALETRERLVVVGETANLEAYVEMPDAGKYTIRGKVNYEGKETPELEYSFTLAQPAASTSGIDLLAVAGWPLAIGALAVVAVVGRTWLSTRRRKQQQFGYSGRH